MVLALISFSRSEDAERAARMLEPSALLTRMVGSSLIVDVYASKLIDVAEHFECSIEMLRPRLLKSSAPIPEEGVILFTESTDPVEAVERLLTALSEVESAAEELGLPEECGCPIVLALPEDIPVETAIALRRAIESELSNRAPPRRLYHLVAYLVSAGVKLRPTLWHSRVLAAMCDYLVVDARGVKSLSNAVWCAHLLEDLVLQHTSVSIVLDPHTRPTDIEEALKPLHRALSTTLCFGLGTPGENLLTTVSVVESTLHNLENVIVEEGSIVVGRGTLVPKPLRVRAMKL